MTRTVLAWKHFEGRNLKPLFVYFVLEQIWAVYEAVTGGDRGKLCVDLSFFHFVLSLLACVVITVNHDFNPNPT